MEKAGWSPPASVARPLCPTTTPSPRVSRSRETPKEAAPVATTEIPRNDAPKPSRADNQRVHDELDAAYDLAAGR